MFVCVHCGGVGANMCGWGIVSSMCEKGLWNSLWGEGTVKVCCCYCEREGVEVCVCEEIVESCGLWSCCWRML